MIADEVTTLLERAGLTILERERLADETGTEIRLSTGVVKVFDKGTFDVRGISQSDTNAITYTILLGLRLARQTNYQRFVGRQTLGKLALFGTHLWLEHVLIRSMYAVLPNPNALFKGERNIGFPQLISLCEAHQIIEAPLAEILRRVNAMRNKCAHQAIFQPGEPEWEKLRVALKNMGPLAEEDLRAVEEADQDDPIEIVAALVEVRALRVGATEIDAG